MTELDSYVLRFGCIITTAAAANNSSDHAFVSVVSVLPVEQ